MRLTHPTKTPPLLAFFLWLLLAAILLPGTAHPIGVEGRATVPLKNLSLADAKKQGLDIALHSAVLNAASLLGPTESGKLAETLKEGDHLAFIKRYSITFESTDGGDYRVILEADVDSLRLKNRLEDFKPPVARRGGSRGVASVTVNIFSNDLAARHLPGANINGEISTVLLGGGFRVKSADGGVQLNTYVTLKPQDTSYQTTSESGRTLCNVWMKALDSSSGSIVAEVSATEYFIYGSDDRDVVKILKKTARDAASKMTVHLQNRLVVKHRRSDLTEVVFNGVTTYGHWRTIDGIMSKSLLGIQSITKRRFARGTVIYTVSLRLEPENFARVLTNLKPRDMALSLKSIEGNRIAFNVIH